MRSLLRLLCFLLLASSATAIAQPDRSASPLSGVWVPGDLLDALKAQRPQEIPCFLVIEPEPLEVVEDCAGGRTRWSGAVLEAERAGRLEVRAGTQRRLVFRAGTPNELELVRGSEGEAEFVRLYRVPAALEDRLRSWAAAQQILVGTWRTPEGVEAEFTAAGSYRLAQEHGRYRLAVGAPVPGAWGVILLEPEGDASRIYLLAGAGRRLGLALPPPDLGPALHARFAEVDPGAGAGGQERGIVPALGDRPGQELAKDPSGIAPTEGDATSSFGAPIGAPAEHDADPLLQGAGGAPAEDAAPPALEVAIRLERAGPGVELQPTAQAVPEPDPPEMEGQAPPPIAQPIEPRGRCGCDAAEGALGLGIFLVALALPRRRRHPRGRGAERR